MRSILPLSMRRRRSVTSDDITATKKTLHFSPCNSIHTEGFQDSFLESKVETSPISSPNYESLHLPSDAKVSITITIPSQTEYSNDHKCGLKSFEDPSKLDGSRDRRLPTYWETAQQVYLNSKFNGEETLPMGWEARTTPLNETYYLNHRDQTSQWERPTALEHFYNGQLSRKQAKKLPKGWEARTDFKGRTYYVDHNTKTTTWTHPDRVSEEKVLPLPPGWKEKLSKTGKLYFMDCKTKVTAWACPKIRLGIEEARESKDGIDGEKSWIGEIFE